MTSDKRMSDERLAAMREFAISFDEIAECVAEIDALRADLAAARRVDEGEVGQVVERLKNVSTDFMYDEESIDVAIDLLTRLSAAKEEAERNWAEQEKRATLAQTDLNIAQNKLAQAERERDRARTDALVDAEKIAQTQLDRWTKSAARAKKRAGSEALLKAAGYQGEPELEEIEAEAFRDMAGTILDGIRALKSPSPVKEEQ